MKTAIPLKYFVLLAIPFCLGLSAKAQEPLRYSNMLLTKTDVDFLMSTKAALGKIVVLPSNNAAKDANRRTFELVIYAFNTKNVLIPPYNPLRLTSSTTDSLYTQDMFMAPYTITKATLQSLIPNNPYSFLRFKPFNNRTDAILKNFVSYKVYPVAVDGLTAVKKDGATSGTPTLDLNPAPPR